MNRQNIGNFMIRMDVVQSEPETLLGIMSKCIVVRAELLYEHDAIKYTAISDHFQEVPQGCRAPEYIWLSKDGEWSATRKSA